MSKKVHILGGGTVAHIRSHLALAAPAYGTTARSLAKIARERFIDMDIELHLTRMARDQRDGAHDLGETNDDVDRALDHIKSDLDTKIIFMNVALCDFEPIYIKQLRTHEGSDEIGKNISRLQTSAGDVNIHLTPAPKVIRNIRRHHKHIFLIGFKMTHGASEQEQFRAALGLLKESSCNLVLANDTKTRINMIVTPEEARYHVTQDRQEALKHLVDMAWYRSHLTFTRSTVIDGQLISWHDPRIPSSLRSIVNHCIARGAYKPFAGATVGHFACKVDDRTFLTSIRKSNFNDIEKNGLVLVKTNGPDTVLAYGAKPSVGGQSQRLIFRDHPGMDCIVHFHCLIKPGSSIPVRSQREFECGSHECGQNTSSGLGGFGKLKAVYLNQHGPNIVFNRNIDPTIVIDFIESNFELAGHTGGYIDNQPNQEDHRNTLSL